MVKLFGAGGFKGLPSYGTGILVSPDGFILTVNNHILATTDLRVHLYDGRFYHAKVVAKEPELDIALVKIEEEVDNLPHFEFAKEAARPLAGAGDWILAFSNQFQIATRDEPMSVQRGVIAAHAELRGRRGVFDAPFSGEVYFLDTVACNPGAAGGIVTNRKGELLGILGRELRNTLTDTWINYAIPIQAKAEVQVDEKSSFVDMATFVDKAMKGTYRQSEKRAKVDKGGYHGIILVPNVVSATPPYVEEVTAESPAAKAGLQADDLIVYVEGELVPSIKIFRDLMKGFGPGMEVKLEVQRGTKLKGLKLKLIEAPKAKKAT
jgi:serine protease Do